MLPRSWLPLNVGAWACVGAMAFLAAPFVASAQAPSQIDETSEKAPASTSTSAHSSRSSTARAAENASDAGANAKSEKAGAADAAKDKTAEPEFVRKSLEEWRRELPPAVFMVARQGATEPPFSGKYATGHFRGIFICACCEAELFDARHKFESGTGWPSFWRPISAKAVVLALDNSMPGEPRLEAQCRRCGAHLGHRFSDNPAAPTGWRFCIDTLSLKLKAPDGRITSPVSKARSRSRTKAHVKSRSRRSASKTRPQGANRAHQARGSTTERPGDDDSATAAKNSSSDRAGSSSTRETNDRDE